MRISAQKFKLDREKLVKYIMCIEDNYPSNEYHNRIHAAFVVQRTYVTFMKLNLRANSADKDLWLLAAVLGAAVHDVLHPGYNNQYMVLEEATVARTYNDQAVLENQSLYMALELMRSKESNFIHNSSLAAPAKWRQVKTHLNRGFYAVHEHTIKLSKPMLPASSSNMPSLLWIVLSLLTSASRHMYQLRQCSTVC